jgi:hypothetical protein
VLGKGRGSDIQTPYLIVVETKHGVEAKNPQYQLYGQLLAAAWMNWQDNHQPTQEIWGCYTIADVWTFNRAEVTGFETDRPQLIVEISREYSEKREAEAILKILKQIVVQYLPSLELAA